MRIAKGSTRRAVRRGQVPYVKRTVFASGYGRIVRSEEGRVLKIVEEKDTTIEEKKITEVNTMI